LIDETKKIGLSGRIGMELNVRLAGAAGQGLQTAAELLGLAATRAGLWAAGITDAESRIRGGLNFSHLRLAAQPRQGVRQRIDLLVALTQEALDTFAPDLDPQGGLVPAGKWPHPKAAPFCLDELAERAGSTKTRGTVAVAVTACLVGIGQKLMDKVVQDRFGGNEKILDLNRKAVKEGFAAAKDWAGDRGWRLLEPGTDPGRGKERLWLGGAQAAALGAVAGGASFLAGYPMSPATGTMAALADWAAETGMVVEQAEDEVAAINMVAGASYAGARAMTATSGGGFCLMTEGISLLGMIEAPAVIVLAQRPGPATGLPTRVAQGDLNLVRHAGHGFFPRIILAPRDIPDCFSVTARAFDLAEKYQVPVFVLTDQLLQDGQASCEVFKTAGLPKKRYLLGPEELEKRRNYLRFALTKNGISALAAPGASRQTVVVDSDEHDQAGHITEEAETAARMAAKRQAKAGTVARAAWPLEVKGEVRGRPLVISWGSTFGTVAEALEGLPAAHLHLRWLWPLDGDKLREALKPASSIIVIENSVGGELVSVLEEVTRLKVSGLINRTDGRPMTVEELGPRLAEEVE
jgi:2-oxoglutarate ferredoxin oxidoreductase subunit alpha